jgi:hypothetical protein
MDKDININLTESLIKTLKDAFDSFTNTQAEEHELFVLQK